MWEDRFSVNLLVGSPERAVDPGTSGAGVRGTRCLSWPGLLGICARSKGSCLTRPKISIRPGPMERGDLDAEPRLLYVAYRARPIEAASTVKTAPALARFEDGIELLGWEAEPAGEGQTRVRLRWRATEPLSTDYNVFVHMVSGASESGASESGASESGALEGQRVVVQDDGMPGAGHYATSMWRPGDEIVDEHVVAALVRPAARSDRCRLVRVEFDATFTYHFGKRMESRGQTGTYYGHPPGDVGGPPCPADKGRASTRRRRNTSPARILGLNVGPVLDRAKPRLCPDRSSHRGGYTCDCYVY